MKRLLCIVGSMNAGGAETFLMKIYRKLDKSRFQMDFAVAVKDKGYYDDEIISMGGRIFYITPKSAGAIQNFNSIRTLVKNEEYKFVLRTSQHSLSALELLAAWTGGAKIRIFRSSNSNTTTGGGIDAVLHRLCMFMPRLFANVRIAPSTEAAEFMFGKNCVRNGKASILHNSIDLELYKYEEIKKKQILNEFNISDKYVVGHVGRFNQQKNHIFLLDVFKNIIELKSNAVLMLVGKGELEEQIKGKAEELGFADKIIFTGVRSDVPALMSAMDVFVFPSLYEGMPNTVIEAQATGLPCVIADTITREAEITDIVKFQSLSSSPEIWAEEALSISNMERKDTREEIIRNRYDIDSTVKDFVKLVFVNEHNLGA